MLPRHARCVLSRLRCNAHSFLLSSYLSWIGRIENSSCSACGHLSSHSALYSYGLFAPLTLWRLSGPGPRELPGFWYSAMPQSLGRGRVINNEWFFTGKSKSRANPEYSRKTSFAFVKTAWFCFTFLGSEGA